MTTEPIPVSEEVTAIRDETIADLVARLIDNRARQEQLETEHKHLRAVLLTLLPKGRSKVGDSSVTVAQYRRFSPRLAQKMLTSEQYDAICEQVPSATLARQVLPPEDYEACSGTPTTSLTIK